VSVKQMWVKATFPVFGFEISCPEGGPHSAA